MESVFLFLIVIASIVLFLKLWNIFSENYNNKIIANSKCENCDSPLGYKCITIAAGQWETEKLKRIKENKSVLIILRNLDFICEKCGHPNSEQKIYKKNRVKK